MYLFPKKIEPHGRSFCPHSYPYLCEPRCNFRDEFQPFAAIHISLGKKILPLDPTFVSWVLGGSLFLQNGKWRMTNASAYTPHTQRGQ